MSFRDCDTCSLFFYYCMPCVCLTHGHKESIPYVCRNPRAIFLWYLCDLEELIYSVGWRNVVWAVFVWNYLKLTLMKWLYLSFQACSVFASLALHAEAHAWAHSWKESFWCSCVVAPKTCNCFNTFWKAPWLPFVCLVKQL